MFRSQFLSLFIFLNLLTGGICQGQESSPSSRPTIEMDFDFRSLVSDQRSPKSWLYSSGVRVDDDFASGWHLNLYGTARFKGFLPQQLSVEKRWGNNHVEAGMVSIPFGIYDVRETYASGLIDYPMPRMDYYYNSVSWGTPGVAWSGGSPTLQFEAAGFGGASTGSWSNVNNVGGAALRVQTYTHGLILGASRWDGYYASTPGSDDRSPVHMSGLDIRYTLPHLLLRGEYLLGGMGDDFEHGWYMDVYYHLPKYSKITLVGRLEELSPGSSDPTGKQVTLGVRYAASKNWVFAVNWRKNNMDQAYAPSWTPYTGKAGALYFQVYNSLRF